MDNPANATGTIDTVEVWVFRTMTTCIVGTLYLVSGDDYKCRDSESIGTLTQIGKVTTSGLSISVETSDYLGIYFDPGEIERDTTGYGGIWYVSGEHIDPNDQATYSSIATTAISLYGTGTEPAVAWANKFNGAANAAIGKINGVAIASVKQVNGVA